MNALNAKQRGFAVLMVLVAVVILMLLYFVQIDTLFGPGLPSEPAGIEQHPWVLTELLVPPGEAIKLPRPPKLRIDAPLSITAPVSRNDSDRGTVSIAFEQNGRIHGRWQCTYEQSGVSYRIDAQMNGNIDARRTYRDEQGKDKSRLFLIARGQYTKTPLEQAAAGAEKGVAWLIGWIDPDRGITGHVTITRNEQWAAAYAFSASE